MPASSVTLKPNTTIVEQREPQNSGCQNSLSQNSAFENAALENSARNDTAVDDTPIRNPAAASVRDGQSPIDCLSPGTGMPLRRVFLKGLQLDAQIGAYAHEKGKTQPIIINLDVDVAEPANPLSDELSDIFCYDALTCGIKEIIARGHIQLVETLAEQIAILCLAHPLCLSVRVSVEKPIAIREAAGAGVTIFRAKDTSGGI